MPLLSALKQHAQLWRDSVLPTLLPSQPQHSQERQQVIEDSLADTTAPIQQGILSSLHQLTSMSLGAAHEGGEGSPPFLPLAMFARLTCHTYNKMALAAMQEHQAAQAHDPGQVEGGGAVLLHAAHVFLSAAGDSIRV